MSGGVHADDPAVYGRIILSEDNMVKAIIEDKDVQMRAENPSCEWRRYGS